jgi:hypothetical protein
MTMTDDKLREELIGMGYDEGAVDEMMRHEEGTSSSSAPAQSCGALEWRSEPPTEEGFYFHKNDDLYDGNGNDPGYGVQWVREEFGVLYATMLYQGSLQEGPVTHEMFDGDEWAGPIPEPSEA